MGWSGVTSYHRFTLNVYMPEDNDCCQYCPVIRYTRDNDMRMCGQTGEYLPHYKARRGDRCPLVEVEG